MHTLHLFGLWGWGRKVRVIHYRFLLKSNWFLSNMKLKKIVSIYIGVLHRAKTTFSSALLVRSFLIIYWKLEIFGITIFNQGYPRLIDLLPVWGLCSLYVFFIASTRSCSPLLRPFPFFSVASFPSIAFLNTFSKFWARECSSPKCLFANLAAFSYVAIDYSSLFRYSSSTAMLW